MTLTCMCHPAKLIHTTTLLVNQEALGRLHRDWFLLLVEVKVAE